MPGLRIWGRSVLLLLSVNLLIGPTIPEVSSSENSTAQFQECGCPSMPVVATSEHPAKGSVYRELSLFDLDVQFSNRYLMFAEPNAWDDAMTALAHDIDPTGQYHIWERPAPRPVNDVKLKEGTVSALLINPALQGPRTPKLGDIQGIEQALLATLARINKYGEPQAGLRRAVLRLLRFLADDLARIPQEVVRKDRRAALIKSSAGGARTFLENILGHPGYEISAQYQGSLKLDQVDLVNAALDVLWSEDEQHHSTTMFVPTPGALGRDDSQAQFFDVLLNLASVGHRFGGAAASGSPLDAVACRAFSMLVALADVSNPGSAPYRAEVLDEYLFRVGQLVGATYNPDGATLVPQLNTARALLLWVGAPDAQENSRMSFALFMFAQGLRMQGTGWNELLPTMRALTMYAGGPGRDRGRQYFQANFDKLFGNLPNSNNVQLKELFQRWEATSSGPTLASLSGPCTPNPGETSPRVLFYAQTAQGLQSIKDLYGGVPTIAELQFRKGAGKPEYEFELRAGSTTLKLKAHVVDQHGRIYRTDPFLPTIKEDE